MKQTGHALTDEDVINILLAAGALRAVAEGIRSLGHEDTDRYNLVRNLSDKLALLGGAKIEVTGDDILKATEMEVAVRVGDEDRTIATIPGLAKA